MKEAPTPKFSSEKLFRKFHAWQSLFLVRKFQIVGPKRY